MERLEHGDTGGHNGGVGRRPRHDQRSSVTADMIAEVERSDAAMLCKQCTLKTALPFLVMQF